MPLSAGTHLGPYEVLSLVGGGGMGEVYRARDTRLNRVVAVKILIEKVAEQLELRVRFEREAQMLATLSHPHICSVFDVGRHDGVDYLVMEFLEGQTLAERLQRGAMPIDEALRTAIQLTDALDKAHRHGVVHRDLKPGNVVLTKSGAKILDFGLAKLTRDLHGVPGLSGLQTDTAVTAVGTILGTLQYMAPEQLEAKEADSRTDIFALGAIVYEMITGTRTFEAKSQASLIAAILDREPPAMSARQPLTPPSLERVVKKCLAKDPDARWQSASDLLDELKWIAESPIAGATVSSPKAAPISRIATAWAGVASALLVVALAAVGFLYFRSPPEASEIRFEIAVPNISNPRYLTISPNGQLVAFTGSTATGTALFVRRIESTRPEPLAGTDGAVSPFWSPDNGYLAFYSAGRLKKISITDGQVQNICDAPNLAGGTWNADDVIVFSSGGVLNRVPATGGEKVAISVRDDSKQETSHETPFFLPDGTRYLYLAWSPQQANRAVYVGSLDSKAVTKILAGGSKAMYANSGHLLFQRGGTLFAQPFDADTANLTGDPVRIADEISNDALNGEAAFDVSKNGRLVYFAGGGPAVNRRFIWFDRTGRQLGEEGKPGLYTTNFDLSRDGTQIAVAQRNRDNSQYDIWLIDWVRGVPTRFTFDPALSPNGNVVWSQDGKRIAFASERTGNRDIFEKNASGVGVETPLLATAQDEWPEDFSPDGRYLAYGRNVLQGTVGAGAISVLELFGERKSITVADTPYNDDEPRFSPDGKWIAFNSNESGTHQVYLVSFPAGDQKRQISTDGGAQPRWRRDGKQLYYLALDGRVMAVDLNIDSKIDSAVPQPLFNTRLSIDPIRDQFAVTADGQRFLVQLPAVEGAPTPISVRINWTRSLGK